MVAGDKPTMSWSGVPQPFQRIRQRGGEAEATTDGGMRSFVNGIVSPFTACWQPSLDSTCAPMNCGGREFRMQPRQTSKSTTPVVSPLADRVGPAPTSPRSDISIEVSHGYESAGCASPSSVPPATAETTTTTKPSTTDIEKPHSNDVLCGRGGSSNRHLGNMHFRELVAANKKTYVSLTKKQKMLVARKIVETVHSTEPPGRFLAKDLDTGLWYDIGLPRSLEKTSQALREKNSNDFPIPQEDQASEVGSGFEVSSVVSSTVSNTSATAAAAAGENEKSSGSKSSKKKNKNVEAPPLIIPSHLKQFYCPQQQPQPPPESPYHEQSPYHEPSSWSEYGPDHQGRKLEQPHLSSPASSGGPPPGDRYYVPPRTPGYHHHSYPESAPRSPPHHPHYHSSYDSRPPYSRSSGLDYEQTDEHYEYYSRRPPPPDYRDHYGTRVHPSPHPSSYGRGPPHPASRPPPPPPQSHYQRYPPPRHGPSSHSHYYARPPPPHGPPTPPPTHHRPHHQDPYGYGHHPRSPASPSGVPVPPPPTSGMYRSPGSGGYVRSKSEVSPERRQEWKRQRNEVGHPRRLSESSLTNAIETSLTLKDRVVAGPPALPVAGDAETSRFDRRPASELISPSSVLQSRSRRSFERAPQQKDDDSGISTAVTESITSSTSCSAGTDNGASKLSGLAALASAAFAKLDEKA